MWDFSQSQVTFDNANYFWDGSQLVPTPRSASSSTRRIISIPLVTSAAPPIAVPAPSVTATPASSSEIDLVASYTGPPGSATFTFQISTASLGPWITLATQVSPDYAATGLGAGQTYYFQVIVTTNETQARQKASAPVSGTTQAAATVPGQVTGLTVVAIGNTVAYLNCNVVPTTTTYAVYQLIGGTYQIIGGNANNYYSVTGLTPGASYSFYMQAVNAVGPGLASTPVSITMPPPATPGAMKWAPGYKMLSINVNNPSADVAELSALAATAGPGGTNPGLLNGYASQWTWSNFFSGNSPTPNFSSLVTVFNTQQQKFPGSMVCFLVAAYVNWRNTFNANAGNDIVPGFIFNGGQATYGAPSVGGNGAGWILTGYAQSAGATQYDYVNANFSNANVMNQWNVFWQQLMAFNGWPALNGVTYTTDTHPYILAVGDWGPDDIEATIGGNPTLPSSYNGEQWMQNFRARNASMLECCQHTSFLSMPGYGANGDNGVSEELLNVQSIVANRIALSCTDVYPNVPPSYRLTYAQHFAIGDVNTGSNTPPPTFQTGGGVRYVGPSANQTASMPNIQGGGGYLSSVSAVKQACLNATGILGASDVYISYQGPTQWTSIVVPGIIAAGAIPSANQQLPVSYMPQVTGLTLAPAGSMIGISWAALANSPAYRIYRNGTPLVGTVAGTSYTDTQLAPGTYSYTVAMSNANGVGPQSAAQSAVLGYDGTLAVANGVWTNGHGTPLNLRGVDTYGLDSSYALGADQSGSYPLDGAWSFGSWTEDGALNHGTQPDVAYMKSQGVNFVRVPINVASLLGYTSCYRMVPVNATAGLANGATGFTIAGGGFNAPSGTYSLTFSNGNVRTVALTNNQTVVTGMTALTSSATSYIITAYPTPVNMDPAGTYKTQLTTYLDALSAAQIYWCVDFHQMAPNMTVAGINGGASFHVDPDQNMGSFMNSDNTVAAIQALAPILATRPGGCFSPFNEPEFNERTSGGTTWNCWLNGGTFSGFTCYSGAVQYSFPVIGMQAAVNAARAAGIKCVLVLGGVQYAGELGKTYDGSGPMASFMPTDPLGQLAFDCHIYANGAAYNASYTSSYATAFGNSDVISAMNAMIAAGYAGMIGELGGYNVPASTTEPFIRTVVNNVDTVNAAKPGALAVCAWSAAPLTLNSGSTNQTWSYASSTPTYSIAPGEGIEYVTKWLLPHP